MKRTLQALCVAMLTVASQAQWPTPSKADVPAFNAAPPAKTEKLSPILTPDQLEPQNSRYPYQAHAYRLAAKIPSVLYQLPCYCFCDRSAGHHSLRSCFESEHGAHCSTCMQEAVYAYQMTKQNKTPKQIREGIMKGEFQNISLENSTSIN